MSQDPERGTGVSRYVDNTCLRIVQYFIVPSIELVQ